MIDFHLIEHSVVKISHFLRPTVKCERAGQFFLGQTGFRRLTIQQPDFDHIATFGLPSETTSPQIRNEDESFQQTAAYAPIILEALCEDEMSSSIQSRIAVNAADGMPVKGDRCIRIATGNIMTMHPKLCHSGPLAQQGMGQRGAILQRQFSEFGVDIIGLQEGRLPKDLQTKGESYHVRTSAADSSGRYGSQCWVRDSAFLSIGASVPVCPRICYTMTKCGRPIFANVSADSPCRDSPPSVTVEFWSSLCRVLHDVKK